VLDADLLARLALRERFAETPLASESLAFVLRFTILTAGWGVPLVLVVPELTATLAWPASPLAPEAWSSVIGACAAALGLLLLVSTSAALACACDTVAEVLAPFRWRALWGEQRAALPALWASVAGSVALAYLVTLPVILAVGLLVVRVDAYAGILCGLLGYLAPLAVGCVVGARLAGAFARATEASGADPTPLAAAGAPLPETTASRPPPRPLTPPPAASAVSPGATTQVVDFVVARERSRSPKSSG